MNRKSQKFCLIAGNGEVLDDDVEEQQSLNDILL